MASRKKSNTKTPNKRKVTRIKAGQKSQAGWGIKRKIFLLCAVFIVVALCVAFAIKTQCKPKIEDYSIIHEPKFGGVYIKMEIDDFNNLGFKYGDSVDVKFSNGYELTDIPYYNGYYVDIDEPLLIAYPGYDYIKAAVNYGADLWITAGLTDNDTASIYLNASGKYLDIQNARDIHYSDIQGDTSDVVFANFRNVKVGNLKDGILYRSASPVDNSHNRAPVVDRLISAVGVNYIVNLSDGADDLVEHINKEDFNSPYFLSLYNDGLVIPLEMDAQFKSQGFKEKLVQGLTAMAEHDGPYLIHCVEGKDRTGYVLMILESLLSASYDEMVNDYMITYDNYYDISRASDPERYATIKEKNIDLMLHYVIGDESGERDLTTINNYSDYTKNYLLSIGMGEDAIMQLIQNLSN